MIKKLFDHRMKEKLEYDVNKALGILSARVDKEWNKMEQSKNSLKKLEETYDLFFSRIL